jgi:alanine dehydrogenase
MKMTVSLADLPQEKTSPVPTKQTVMWDPDMVLKRKFLLETEYQTAKRVESILFCLAKFNSSLKTKTDE